MIISDFSITPATGKVKFFNHLKTLSNMKEEDFELLCDKVTPHLIDEFKLWSGNNDLLDSCFTKSDSQETEPARIILNRVKQMLQDFNGFLVIT